MKNIFFVFGYGIPRNIAKDDNYHFYLTMVFHTMYDVVIKKDMSRPMIICSGGNTDIYKPYKRTEGEEMVKLFQRIIQRPCVKQRTNDWNVIAEKTALSTVENFLHCMAIVKRKKIYKAHIFIFCEKTRGKRIKRLATEILDGKNPFQVVPIDFDVSENRYLDPAFIQKKEKLALKHDLWALQSPENLKKYHHVFEERLKFLRNAGSSAHTEAVRQWWEKRMKVLDEKNACNII